MVEEITKKTRVNVLNTFECVLKEGYKGMVCTVESLDEHSGMEVRDVYSVCGDIRVIHPVKGRLWIKTHPYIGMDAFIDVVEREEPKGKDVIITVV